MLNSSKYREKIAIGEWNLVQIMEMFELWRFELGEVCYETLLEISTVPKKLLEIRRCSNYGGSNYRDSTVLIQYLPHVALPPLFSFPFFVLISDLRLMLFLLRIVSK